LSPASTVSLARSLKDLQDIVHELKTKNAALKATEQPIDTGSAAGKAFLDMLGVFAEFETNLRRERQLEGIKAAKERGVVNAGRILTHFGACRRSNPDPPCRPEIRSGRLVEGVHRRYPLPETRRLFGEVDRIVRGGRPRASG
jgi:DNA invertase Pin-like site-specific DNA recombinase